MQLELVETATKAERVRKLLKSRGAAGASNGELNDITFRYSAIIHTLRKQGYDIETRKMGNSGHYQFIMWREI